MVWVLVKVVRKKKSFLIVLASIDASNIWVKPEIGSRRSTPPLPLPPLNNYYFSSLDSITVSNVNVTDEELQETQQEYTEPRHVSKSVYV